MNITYQRGLMSTLEVVAMMIVVLEVEEGGQGLKI